jgi:hypothetical protein
LGAPCFSSPQKCFGGNALQTKKLLKITLFTCLEWTIGVALAPSGYFSRRSSILKTMLIFTTLLAALPLGATPITIVNPSFESDVVGSGGYLLYTAAGWTASSGAYYSTFDPAASQLASGPQDGVNVLAIEMGNLSQTLSTVLTANTLYTLQVGVGSRSDGFFIESYQFDLEAANGAVLASVTSPTPANGTFTTATLTFAALSGNPNLGQDLLIRLINTDPSGNSQVQFDNVRLDGTPSGTSSTPEPSSLLLAAVGLAGFVGYRLHRPKC